MVLKYLERFSPTFSRLLFDAALLLVAVSVVFNFFAWGRLSSQNKKLTSIAVSNNRNGIIIKAATGCGDTDSVDQCKQRIQDSSQAQLPAFTKQVDCWTRRSIAHLPPPPSYAANCQLP